MKKLEKMAQKQQAKLRQLWEQSPVLKKSAKETAKQVSYKLKLVPSYKKKGKQSDSKRL